MGTAIYRSLHALKPWNPRKVSPARSVKKVSKKSQMTRKWVKKTTKLVFGDFLDTFLTLRAGRPGSTFLRLFGDFGARGCRDSCLWRFPSQNKCTDVRITADVLAQDRSGSQKRKAATQTNWSGGGTTHGQWPQAFALVVPIKVLRETFLSPVSDKIRRKDVLCI